MNRKRVIDFAAVCVFLAALGIAWIYFDGTQWQKPFIWMAGILAVIFMALGIADKGAAASNTRERTDIPSETEVITEATLLSEENTSLMTWDLYGKTSMVIGRDVKENQVDLNLGKSPYASMVDMEHAVLNYSAGSWYVEDLGSSNGISVKKAGDGRLYKLSQDTPCRLERGDCLYVGLNRLLLR